jgi:hypothetical protein
VQDKQGVCNSLLHVLVLYNKDGVNDCVISNIIKKNPAVLSVKNTDGLNALQALIYFSQKNHSALAQLRHTGMLLAKAGADITDVARKYDSISGLFLHELVLKNKEGVNDLEISELIKIKPEVLAVNLKLWGIMV